MLAAKSHVPAVTVSLLGRLVLKTGRGMPGAAPRDSSAIRASGDRSSPGAGQELGPSFSPGRRAGRPSWRPRRPLPELCPHPVQGKGSTAPASCRQAELGPGIQETLAGVPPPPPCPPLQGLCLLQRERPGPSQPCLPLPGPAWPPPAQGSRSHPSQGGTGPFQSLFHILTNRLKCLIAWKPITAGDAAPWPSPLALLPLSPLSPLHCPSSSCPSPPCPLSTAVLPSASFRPAL